MSEDFIKFCLQCKNHNTTFWKSSHLFHHVCTALPPNTFGNRHDLGTLMWKSAIVDKHIKELITTDEKVCPMYLEYLMSNQNAE